MLINRIKTYRQSFVQLSRKNTAKLNEKRTDLKIQICVHIHIHTAIDMYIPLVVWQGQRFVRKQKWRTQEERMNE